VKLALPELVRGGLEARLPADVAVAWYATADDVAAAAHDADVLMVGFIDPAEVRTAIDSAPHARWISTHAAGVDHYPLAVIEARNLILTKGAGIGAGPIADFVVLCILSAAKRFPFFLAAMQRHEWTVDRPGAIEMEGSRALILGYGAIGRAVGRRLGGFGVEVVGVRRTPDGEPGVIGPAEWPDRLGEFDWVVVTTALTGVTRHLIGPRELARLKPTAWLVNVARGGLVDQSALVAALGAGQLEGAYLDVTDPEPLPADDPLWSTPNVYISGHSAGRGSRSMERYGTLFLDNLARFRAGQTLVNVVDPRAGY
jgi:phosphoglycerate dehydrogenase-like enzyme